MPSLTPSHIIEFLYCPRFTYFEYVLNIPQHEEANYMVQRGRNIHDEKLEKNKDYLRKRLGVVDKKLDQYLTNDLIRGRVDEVLVLKDGNMAPLDYKFAEYKNKVYDTYKTQLYCYAWLIEQNFGKPVHKGFLVYTRSRHKVIEVPITEADKDGVKKAAADIFAIIEQNHYPRATKYKARCLSCTYKNICIK
ncbi:MULTISPECIES: CRISPR-associated protein Cas4 [Dyadobacter]|uniref:CRISPR-associated exonuclease Cas4 n=1 Tax=Dyadobacter jejuensis TaxID=1082580 RepID=A0A316AJW4_9BACT|nr:MULTISPECIES: CRISPR-associated protein Cas4 [Dyadobacter]PWJ57274.1 CRISPR-associated exonuclease Cas4 [Dyadobacter jejuensis]